MRKRRKQREGGQTEIQGHQASWRKMRKGGASIVLEMFGLDPRPPTWSPTQERFPFWKYSLYSVHVYGRSNWRVGAKELFVPVYELSVAAQ